MSDAITPERLADIGASAEFSKHHNAEARDVLTLLAHVDHLTSEVVRLREGIEDAKQEVWEAWVECRDPNKGLDVSLDRIGVLLADLLNPPTEGTDHDAR